MATVIRLTRKGRTHTALYRVVVADSRVARDGKFLEEVGFYNPNKEVPEVSFNNESVVEWLSKGAQPSDTIKSLLKLAGVWDMWIAKKKGEDVSNFVVTPKEFKGKKKTLGPKAKARLEAENAPKEEALAE